MRYVFSILDFFVIRPFQPSTSPNLHHSLRRPTASVTESPRLDSLSEGTGRTRLPGFIYPRPLSLQQESRQKGDSAKAKKEIAF